MTQEEEDVRYRISKKPRTEGIVEFSAVPPRCTFAYYLCRVDSSNSSSQDFSLACAVSRFTHFDESICTVIHDATLNKEISATTSNDRKFLGYCKLYKRDKGYGFISSDNFEGDIFVHVKDFNDDIEELAKGDYVMFNVISGRTPGALQALSVTRAYVEDGLPQFRISRTAPLMYGRAIFDIGLQKFGCKLIIGSDANNIRPKGVYAIVCHEETLSSPSPVAIEASVHNETSSVNARFDRQKQGEEDDDDS